MLTRRTILATGAATLTLSIPQIALAQQGQRVEITYVYTTNPPPRRMVITIVQGAGSRGLRATVDEGGQRRSANLQTDPDRVLRVAQAVRQRGGRIRAGRYEATLSLLGDELMVRLGLPDGTTVTGTSPNIGPAAAVVIGGAITAAGALGAAAIVAGAVVAIAGAQGTPVTATVSAGEVSADVTVGPAGG